jgi:ribosomal protein S18 acetylase RimI-like enzyme
VPATDADIDELMEWFPSPGATKVWGGPKFRYPFSPESFRADCHWPAMATFVLRDSANTMAAFGQFYDRNGRINFARLVAHPDRRGEGVGRRLLTALMEVAPRYLDLDEFSLFVYRDNAPALGCYRSLGFEIQRYPADQALADECYYLTRPVRPK